MLLQRPEALAAVVVFVLAIASGAHAAGPSPAAEVLWNRLPNWSYAGYRAQEMIIPKPPAVASVALLYADGKTDATSAIQSAINTAAKLGGGAVQLPEGTLRITSPLTIAASGVVLRGGGMARTFIAPDRSLAEALGVKINFTNAYNSRFSWWDGWIRIKGPKSISSDDGPANSADEVYVPQKGSGEVLARVVRPAKAGSRRFAVDSGAGIAVGAVVRFFMDEPGSLELIHEMYGNAVLKACPKCLDSYVQYGQPDLVHFPTRVVAVEPNGTDGLTWIVLERAIPWTVLLKFLPTIRAYPKGTPMDSGVEDLTVEFPHTPAPIHHKETGFNGIYVIHAANIWIRNVEIINSDTGINLHNVDFSTLTNVVVRTSKPRAKPGYSVDSHIGIGASFCNDCLVRDFKIDQISNHDTSVRGTTGMVFLRGSGPNLNFDGHRAAPWGTLYSDIEVGVGSRLYSAGGYGTKGYPMASFTTYANISLASGQPVPLPATCSRGTQMNFIGSFQDTQLCPGYWRVQTDETSFMVTLPQARILPPPPSPPPQPPPPSPPPPTPPPPTPPPPPSPPPPLSPPPPQSPPPPPVFIEDPPFIILPGGGNGTVTDSTGQGSELSPAAIGTIAASAAVVTGLAVLAAALTYRRKQAKAAAAAKPGQSGSDEGKFGDLEAPSSSTSTSPSSSPSKDDLVSSSSGSGSPDSMKIQKQYVGAPASPLILDKPARVPSDYGSPGVLSEDSRGSEGGGLTDVEAPSASTSLATSPAVLGVERRDGAAAERGKTAAEGGDEETEEGEEAAALRRLRQRNFQGRLSFVEAIEYFESRASRAPNDNTISLRAQYGRN